MRIPECHPDRPHQARGLCAQCYMREYDEERSESRKTERRKDPSEYAENYRRPPHAPARVPECGHPEREHLAMGMCGPCYRVARKEAGAGYATCHPDRPVVARGLCSACYGKRRYELNPEEARQLANESHKRMRDKLRDELIAAYGGKCSCPRCPESNPAFLTLEHVNGDGKAHRAKVGSHAYADLRKRGWPKEGYTLLCWNCNAMTRGGRTCPHLEAD